MLPVPGFRFLPRAGGSKSCPSVHSICWATLQGWAVPVGGMGGLHKMAHQPMITIFTTEHLYPTPKQPAQTCPAPCPICSVHTPRPSISVPLVAVCQREFAVMRPDTAIQRASCRKFPSFSRRQSAGSVEKFLIFMHRVRESGRDTSLHCAQGSITTVHSTRLYYAPAVWYSLVISSRTENRICQSESAIWRSKSTASAPATSQPSTQAAYQKS